MTKKEYSFLAIIILVVAAITIFLGGKKCDFYIDEAWTYGLANNIGSTQPDIEYGKAYTGMGPYENFFEVNKGEGFNYVNVWQNQANDVHPPLYYVFVHTVCSFFPDSFSKWYGISVNIMWMAFITVLLYLLAKEISGSITSAIGIVLAYETTTLFFDTLLFIRMYAQLTVAFLAIALLLKKYWDKPLDKRFYTLLTISILFGMMTHYYFLIFAFFICAGFAIRLFLDKRFVDLKRCIITALCDGIAFLAMWYHFAGHLFRGYRGKEAIQSALTFGGLTMKFARMMKIINEEAFAGLIIIFALIALAQFVIKLKKKEAKFSYECVLFLSGLFFTLVVSKIAPYMHSRYLMPVVFIYTITAYMALRDLVSKLPAKKWTEYAVIALFLAMNIWTLNSYDYYVPMSYYSEKLMGLCDDIKGKDCVVLINIPWESLNFYMPLQNADSYTFVTPETFDDALAQIDKECIIATTTSYVDQLDEDIQANEIFKVRAVRYYKYNP